MGTLFPGSVPRPLNLKIGERVSILDFAAGATIWDGSTDAAPALNAAIASVTAGSPHVGAEIYLPGPAIYLCNSPITLPSGTTTSPITLCGDSPATVLMRGAAMPTGIGFIDINGSNVTLRNLIIDGNTTGAPVGLRYGYTLDFDMDPMSSLLTSNTSIWVHGGVSDVTFENIQIQHTGGYAILLDARTGNVSRVLVRRSQFRNNRPHLFGIFRSIANVSGTTVTYVSGDTFPATLYEVWINGTRYGVSGNTGSSITLTSSAPTLTGATIDNTRYGSWTGGIHYQMDGVSANTSVKDLLVENCIFHRNTGNQIWGHAYSVTNGYHERLVHNSNEFVDIGEDGIEFGQVLGGTAVGNTFRRMGYICLDDTTASLPGWCPGAESTALDCSGLVKDVVMDGNTFTSINGGAINGDGLCYSVISNNTGRIPVSGDTEYTEDSIAIFGPGSAGNNWSQGIVIGNSVNLEGGDGNVGTGNSWKNFGGANYALYCCRNNRWHGNSCSLPAFMNQVPVSLGNTGTGTNQRTYNAVFTDLVIYWSPSTVLPCVVEDGSLGAFQSGDKNWISGIRIFGNGNAYAFKRDVNTSTTTAIPFASQFAALALDSTHYVQREGRASDYSSVLRSYISEGGNEFLHSQLQGFSTQQRGTVNTSGTAVTGITGLPFNVNWAAGTLLIINGVSYTLASSPADATHCTLTTSAGTQTGVNWNVLSPMLNVSLNGVLNTGAIGTGNRTTSLVDDSIVTGKVYGDAFYALSSTTYTDPEANLFPNTVALIRFKMSVGYFEQSVTVSGGARVWTPLGGASSVAGSDTWVQYNKAGVFGADDNLRWDYTDQILIVMGKVGDPSILSATGYIQSSGGFLSTANSWQGFNSATDGALLCGYGLIQSGSSGGYVDMVPLAYGNYPVPLNPLSAFGATDVLVWAGAVNGTGSPNSTYGLNTNAFMDAAAGFATSSSAANAIQAPNGGVTALSLISVRNDGAPGLTLDRTSTTARQYGLGINSAGSLVLTDVTATAVRLTMDTTGLFTFGSIVEIDQSGNITANGLLQLTGGAATGLDVTVNTAYNSIQTIGGVLAGVGGMTVSYVPSGANFPTFQLASGFASPVRLSSLNATGAGRLDLTVNLDFNGSALTLGNTGFYGTHLTMHSMASATNTAFIFAVVTASTGAANVVMQGLNNGNWSIGPGSTPSSTAGTVLTLLGVSSVSALTILNGFVYADGGFLTPSTAYNAIQATAGGMYASLGLTTDQALYPKGYSSSSSLNTPASGYGGLGYKSGSVYWYYNGSSWASVDFSTSGSGIATINSQSGPAFTIAGTANEIIATTTTNTVTLSTPQAIATTSNVVFGVISSGNSGASITFQNSNGNFEVNGNGAVSIAGVLTSSGASGGVNVTSNSSNNSIQTSGGISSTNGYYLSVSTQVINSSGEFTSPITGSSIAFRTSNNDFQVDGNGNISITNVLSCTSSSGGVNVTTSTANNSIQSASGGISAHAGYWVNAGATQVISSLGNFIGPGVSVPGFVVTTLGVDSAGYAVNATGGQVAGTGQGVTVNFPSGFLIGGTPYTNLQFSAGILIAYS